MLFGGLGFLKLLQTFWGLAVILGLGGYSLYHAGQPADPAQSASGSSASASLAIVQPTAVRTPRPTPIGGFPTPSPLTVFLACDGPDGDAARYYVSSPGGFVVLRIDVDRDLILQLMAGEPTRLGTNPTLVQTPCVRSLIRSGRFP